MNILTEHLPTAVLINGRETPINVDFRAALRTILAFEDDTLTGYEKQMILLGNLYAEQPEDLEAAIQQGMKFLNGGKVGETSGGEPRLFSFEKDADFVFAAFRQTHGIDLETAELHWWKFLALFMDLGADTTFCNLIGLRKRVKSGTASKEERAAASQMGDLFDIPQPDTHTPDERETLNKFLAQVKEGKNKHGENKS